MERERWLQLYRLLCRLDKGAFRGAFRAAAVVGVYFWAVLHDRPTSWACSAANWPGGLWRGPLPSQATMSASASRPARRRVVDGGRAGAGSHGRVAGIGLREDDRRQAVAGGRIQP